MVKRIDVRKHYEYELKDINHILENLKKGKYYENTGAKMDGYLETNILKVQSCIEDLIDKIEYNKESNSEFIAKEYNKFSGL